jgi:Mg-chelatase subunit ChlD
VEAATPEAKDVVIVIDTSGSMGNLYGSQTLISIAKEAANTVIDTLNPNDRVSDKITMFYK